MVAWSNNLAPQRPSFEERLLDYSAAGDALFQEQVNRVIRRCHKRTVGAISALRFERWSGDAYYLNRQTPGPDAVWVSDAAADLPTAYDPTSPGSVDEATYAKVSFEFKTLFAAGVITRKVIARGRGFADVLALELMDVTERVTYALEKTTFQGNIGGGATKEFDGLFELLNSYNGSGSITQLIVPDDATLDATPANTTAGNLTLRLLDKLIDEVKDGPKVIFVSKTGRRMIRELLQAQQVFNDATQVEAGFDVMTYQGAPVIATDGITNTMLCGDDGSGYPEITAFTGGATTAVVCVNTEDVFYAELTPLTVAPIEPGETLQWTKFEAFWDGTLVLSCPQSAAAIVALDPSE